MYKPVQTVALPVIVLAALTACGGGGGGGGNTIREVPFTSFSATTANQAVVMTGIAQTASANSSGSTIFPVTLGPGDSSATLRLSFDRNEALVGIDFSSPQSSASFDAAGIVCVPGACGAGTTNGLGELTSLAAVGDAPALGWNYQTFGFWMRDLTSPVIQAGAISAGSVTPGDAVPKINGALFAGGASGLYVDAGGNAFLTSAVMNANADFQSRTVGFATTGTLKTTVLTNIQTPDSGLNISGTLGPYAEGTNQFTGQVTTTNNPAFMIGNATGRFYGPGAEEIGGVFGLAGPGGTLIGGWGGRRP